MAVRPREVSVTSSEDPLDCIDQPSTREGSCVSTDSDPHQAGPSSSRKPQMSPIKEQREPVLSPRRSRTVSRDSSHHDEMSQEDAQSVEVKAHPASPPETVELDHDDRPADPNLSTLPNETPAPPSSLPTPVSPSYRGLHVGLEDVTTDMKGYLDQVTHIPSPVTATSGAFDGNPLPLTGHENSISSSPPEQKNVPSFELNGMTEPDEEIEYPEHGDMETAHGVPDRTADDNHGALEGDEEEELEFDQTTHEIILDPPTPSAGPTSEMGFEEDHDMALDLPSEAGITAHPSSPPSHSDDLTPKTTSSTKAKASKQTKSKKDPKVAATKKTATKKASAAKGRTKVDTLKASAKSRSKRSSSTAEPTESPASEETPEPSRATSVEPDDDTVYCVCRKPYNEEEEDVTMIGCDACDNWFHPPCIGLDENKLEFLDVYICLECEKTTSQRTAYKRICKRDRCQNVLGTKPQKYCSTTCAYHHMAEQIPPTTNAKALKQLTSFFIGLPRPMVPVSVTHLLDHLDPVIPNQDMMSALTEKIAAVEQQITVVQKRQAILQSAIARCETLVLPSMINGDDEMTGKKKRSGGDDRPCGWDRRLISSERVILCMADVEQEDGPQPCMQPRRRCDRHQGWQKTISASLEVESNQLVNRKKDLVEQASQLASLSDTEAASTKARGELYDRLASDLVVK